MCSRRMLEEEQGKDEGGKKTGRIMCSRRRIWEEKQEKDVEEKKKG